MSKENYYKKVGSELFRELRGELSQGQLNRKLGTSYNKAARWETGSLQPTWDDLKSVCHILGKDLDQAIQPWLEIKETGSDAHNIVRLLIGRSTIESISLFLECSESSCRRWLNKKTRVKLSTVLALFDFKGKLAHFIASLVDIKNINTLYSIYKKQARARSFFAEYPDSSLLLMTLSTEAYLQAKHPTNSFISELTGIKLSRVDYMISNLEELGFITREGLHIRDNSGYINFAYVGDEDEVRCDNLIKKFWANYAIEKMPGDSSEVDSNLRTGFEIFTVNEKVKAQIREEMVTFRSRLHEILETNQDSATEVWLLNTQLINLSETSK